MTVFLEGKERLFITTILNNLDLTIQDIPIDGYLMYNGDLKRIRLRSRVRRGREDRKGPNPEDLFRININR